MNSRKYSIIQPFFNSRNARLKNLIVNISAISICSLTGLLLAFLLHPMLMVPFFMLVMILPFFIEPKTIKMFYPFQSIGHVICKETSIEIYLNGKLKVVSLLDVKGVNIELLIRNPAVHSRSITTKHNAYKIIIKCSLAEQYSFYVYNFKDDSKIKNDIYDLNFLGDLNHYSKKYRIRFWDANGDVFVD